MWFYDTLLIMLLYVYGKNEPVNKKLIQNWFVLTYKWMFTWLEHVPW